MKGMKADVGVFRTCKEGRTKKWEQCECCIIAVSLFLVGTFMVLLLYKKSDSGCTINVSFHASVQNTVHLIRMSNRTDNVSSFLHMGIRGKREVEAFTGPNTHNQAFQATLFGPSSICECQDPKDCATIEGPPARDKEIYGFALQDSDFKSWNWTWITTVAWVQSKELVCYAHSHGARAILASGPIVLSSEPLVRTMWARAKLMEVNEWRADGVVFDYERPMHAGSKVSEWYAELIKETRRVFRDYNPSLQVSSCLAWSPDDIDGRNYPVQSIAAASDLVYIMDYDTRSQIFDQCIASANAPYPGMIRGIHRYISLGVAPSQMVLGVPWYGYRYECLPGTQQTATYCPIPQIPFRNVNCSDAAGQQVNYYKISKLVGASISSAPSPPPVEKLTMGPAWDSNMASPFFNTFDGSTVRQYWYDDAASTSVKFAWARTHGLRGVGPYRFDFVGQLGDEDATADMWRAFDVFMAGDNQREPAEAKGVVKEEWGQALQRTRRRESKATLRAASKTRRNHEGEANVA